MEFNKDQFKELMKCAKENNIEFMATAFDYSSLDFLEDLGITSFKFASGELTNIPLLVYAAKLKKPMFISTGACTLDEIKNTYDAVFKYNNKICLFHCTAGYPTEYENLNLRIIETLKKEFPDAVIGYSGHDNGILASSLAFMLGARVFEKHFTLNHSWKGTDHKFSLEPEGLRKQIRDLHRIQLTLGDGDKIIRDFEKDARIKMGKSIYAARDLQAGIILTEKDLCVKSPGSGLPPYYLEKIIGKKLIKNIKEESVILLDHIE